MKGVRRVIIVICGMIGSGKSTFAREKYEYVTECEDGDKTKQIQCSQLLEKEGKNVAHITTYPTAEELEAFPDARYVWINTDYKKCYENILKRQRKRDLDDLKETLNSNKNIQSRYFASQIRFDIVDVFVSSERW